ncbi:hypothetical protein [Novosphingobium sp.]|uniref:hypothetical protein n=1 Tax=Novosphingobium sp. TaxID=1874826 RepID=UPI002605E051|nr:hypothetical protein [Novosphingobium sp.]
MVRWQVADDRLRLDWTEWPVEPAPGAPGGRGFGSTRIDSAARQLGGTIERTFTSAGIVVRIAIPLTA